MSENLDNALIDTPKFSTDKIVGLYKSSFNAATDTTRIQYTLTGGAYYAWWYVIPHAFGQPVFTDVMISTDGGVTYSFTGAMSFSDFNNLYIYAGQSASPTGNPTGTVFYKLVASWIDQYMPGPYTLPNPQDYISNGTIFPPGFPSITPVTTNQTTAIDSRFNYRKEVGTICRVVSGPQGLDFTVYFSDYFPHFTSNLMLNKLYIECLQNQVWAMHGGGVSDPFFIDDSMVTAVCNFGYNYCQVSPDQNNSAWPTKLTTQSGLQGVARYWIKGTV